MVLFVLVRDRPDRALLAGRLSRRAALWSRSWPCSTRLRGPCSHRPFRPSTSPSHVLRPGSRGQGSGPAGGRRLAVLTGPAVVAGASAVRCDQLQPVRAADLGSQHASEWQALLDEDPPARATPGPTATSSTIRRCTTRRSSRPTRSATRSGSDARLADPDARHVGAVRRRDRVPDLPDHARAVPQAPRTGVPISLICATSRVHLDLGRGEPGRRAGGPGNTDVLPRRARLPARADPRLASALGLAMVAAYLVQIRALGLASGWALALALLLWLRTPSGARLRTLAAAVLPAVAVLAATGALNVLVWDRPLIPGGIEAAAWAVRAVTEDERPAQLHVAVLPAADRIDDGLLRRLVDRQGHVGSDVGREVRLVRLPVPDHFSRHPRDRGHTCRSPRRRRAAPVGSSTAACLHPVRWLTLLVCSAVAAWCSPWPGSAWHFDARRRQHDLRTGSP